MKIEYYQRLRNVNRLNAETIHRSYSLMEHSYMVAVLFHHFALLEDVAHDTQTIFKLLHHDIMEVVTTDLPYTVKHLNNVTEDAWAEIERHVAKRHPDLEKYTDKVLEDELTGAELRLFKVCDLLDLWIFLKEEEALGNKGYKCLGIIDRCEFIIKNQFRSVDEYMKNAKF